MFMFSLNSSMRAAHSPPSERELAIHEKFFDHLKSQLAKDNIRIESMRGPSAGSCVSHIYIFGVIYNKSMYTQKEGMDFFRQIENKLISTINEYGPIRPYLQNFPFDKLQISFVIDILDPATNMPVQYPKITRVVGLEDTPKMISEKNGEFIILKNEESL